MNAMAERWIGGCRRELLDRTLIWNQSHLRQILRQYETHHNRHWPQRSLDGAAPLNRYPNRSILRSTASENTLAPEALSTNIAWSHDIDEVSALTGASATTARQPKRSAVDRLAGPSSRTPALGRSGRSPWLIIGSPPDALPFVKTAAGVLPRGHRLTRFLGFGPAEAIVSSPAGHRRAKRAVGFGLRAAGRPHVSATGAPAGSGRQDLGLLAVELLSGDHSPVAQVGQLRQLVRRAGR
jgi:hypothetical protein